VPVEVLVIDDGSTDGTPDLIRTEFAGVRFHRVEESEGYIVQRNRGARMASSPVIFSIDDDATFSTPQTVEQTLREFNDPRVGAVAIPFINVRQDDVVRQRAPDDGKGWVTNSYVGTAHAVRRDVFLKLGGYREHLLHQGEESDFCIRLLAAGYVVTLGRADPIHHFESPRRDFRRMDHYGRRNDVLVAWHNVPMPALVPHLLATTVNGVSFGLRCGRVGRMVGGLASGYAGAIRSARERRPVSSKVYRLARELKKRGATQLDEIAGRLPPLTPPQETEPS
jgi:glycosyltransferase involved in cell wall biosynthesis